MQICPSYHTIHLLLLIYTNMKIATTASLLSLSSLLCSVSAATTPAPHGQAVVLNNCVKDIFVWSVGGVQGPMHLVPSGGNFTENIHRDRTSGGVAIKITRTPNGLFDGSPQMNFAYTFDPTTNDVFYDLSDVFGDPFAGHTVSVMPTNPDCADICWADGRQPSGSQVHDCLAGTGENIVLTTCAAVFCPA